MIRNIIILLTAAIVVGLPFALRPKQDAGEWKAGDPVLTIVSPHNEAIRHEFERAFSRWHQAKHGKPVKIEWLSIGGTSEISRYLTSEYITAFRAWWKARGKPWGAGASETLVDRRFNTEKPPQGMDEARWKELREMYLKFREVDNPREFTCKIDLFFGGGEYDHSVAHGQGLTVAPWKKGEEPEEIFSVVKAIIPPESSWTYQVSIELIPERVSGETWRTPYLFGAVVSTFGICYNLDRLRDLGMEKSPPLRWDDLADPIYIGQIGVADPTKSGSVAKAFEMMIHQKCYQSVRAAGFTDADIEKYEQKIRAARLPLGEVPPDVPAEYQRAVEQGWLDGLRLVQRIGANARYFTDSAGKVPVDVGAGDATAGLAIDFYGRYQAQIARGPDGRERMAYVTPVGGSSVSCDPISLMRGAPNREVATRFIEFVLSEDGQKLWTYRVGTPGGPEKYALRRLPIRRDFYPMEKIGHASSLSMERVGQASNLSMERVGQASSLSMEKVGHASSLSMERVGQASSLSMERVGHASSLSMERVGHASSLSMERVGHASSLSMEKVGHASSLSHSAEGQAGSLTYPFERHRKYAADDLADPTVNPYALAEKFTYRTRWTAGHFNIHRDLIRAMCLDSADELKAAWRAINENGGPSRQQEAMALLGKLPDRPEPLTWRTAPDVGKRFDRLTYMKEWTEFFRANYRKAEGAARK